MNLIVILTLPIAEDVIKAISRLGNSSHFDKALAQRLRMKVTNT